MNEYVTDEQQQRPEEVTMAARDVFMHARWAARRLATVTAELEALDEGWRRGEWLGSGRSWAGHSDPTSTGASYRMSRSQALESERRELEEDVAEARSLASGIGELLGEGYCSALKYRYLENRPWVQVADLLGVCERTAYSRANTALDTIDALGPARVRQAQGIATV